MTDSSKELLMPLVGVFVKWSLELRGSIVCPDGETSLKVHMYIYTENYVNVDFLR